LRGVIDLHCHVLFGIDDGPATIDGSLALARAAAAAGITTIAATPHVSRSYRNESGAIAELVDALNERLQTEGIAVEVLRGAELAASRVEDLDEAELSALHLGDGPWLLLEPSLTQPASGLETVARELQRAGHGIVLAHPERCMAFHRDPLLLESLVHAGALVSITAASLTGRFGEHVRRFALALAERGLVHNVVSDAHDHAKRPPSIARELEQAGLAPLADWLTCAVPEAILAGSEVPARPQGVNVRVSAAQPRSWWRRLSGVRKVAGRG
jgi:protein-tyrosine phosphatase